MCCAGLRVIRSDLSDPDKPSPTQLIYYSTEGIIISQLLLALFIGKLNGFALATRLPLIQFRKNNKYF